MTGSERVRLSPRVLRDPTKIDRMLIVWLDSIGGTGCDQQISFS
jgi:hypothetical protein